jgi:hypothetical protein
MEVNEWHTLKSFLACCVFTSHSLVMASNTGDSSASTLKSSLIGGSFPTVSFLHGLPYRTDLVAPTVFFTTPWHGPRRQHTAHSRMLTVSAGTCFPSRSLVAAVYSCLLRICCLATDVVCLSVSRPFSRNYVVLEPLASNGCFSGSTVLAFSKYATILRRVLW